MRYLLVLLILVGCENPERTGYTPVVRPDPEPEPEIYYQLPDGIPLEMALVYADYQELLSEEKFGLWLESIKGFCDGEITGYSLSSRISLWFKELHETGRPHSRKPDYSRTEEDRIRAWRFWHGTRLGKPDFDAIPAPDHTLSRANKDKYQAPADWYEEHLKGKIYDCVEGYPEDP